MQSNREMMLELFFRSSVYHRPFYCIDVPTVDMRLTDILTLQDNDLMPYVRVTYVSQSLITYGYKVCVEPPHEIRWSTTDSSIMHEALLRANWRKVGGEPTLMSVPDSPPEPEDEKLISEIGLPIGVVRALEAYDIHTVGALAGRREAELSRMKRIGEGSMTKIKEALVRYGLKLKGE